MRRSRSELGWSGCSDLQVSSGSGPFIAWLVEWEVFNRSLQLAAVIMQST